ncbi:hypothetical protein [Arthrobacter sp. YN]|uniref:hypothetical protein n=1 Tax=Arthrobacter sp. YN TaxID=2020486 RepID=UPI0012FDC4C3|nr:hypothetical protein [Arthrobacter sp. YN]
MSLHSIRQDQPWRAASLMARLAPPRRPIAFGPWSAELVGDELASISYSGRQVLRAVKAVVRDQDWQTPQPSACDLDIIQADNELQARWTVKYNGYGVRYTGRLLAKFTAAEVRISFEGVAVHPFRSNRIGLVVLHPPSDAGRTITVEHPDGSSTTTLFPDTISPHQPFMDIAALEWADVGTAFRLSFAGEVFETEDQRNWTDASFKTYSTPLARPFPVTVAAGTTVRQSLLLEAATLEPRAAVEAPSSAGRAHPAGQPTAGSARIGKQAGQVPALGVGAGLRPQMLPDIPQLDAIMVELVGRLQDGREVGWNAQLEAAADVAARHGAGLDIRAVTPDVLSAVPALAPYLPRAKRLAVFHPDSHITEPKTWQDLQIALQDAGFRGSLLAGVRSHFTELNRNIERMPPHFDALTFSITPQMHSTGVADIIDSVPMQQLVAQNALRLGRRKPLHIGPVTLRPRFNAVATSGLASQVEADELQGHPFTAAWLLASIRALTVDGVASASYFEASGPGGITDADGLLNPAGQLLKELAALRWADVLSVDPAGGPTTLYPVQSPAGLIVFAGNLSGEAVVVDLQLPEGETADGSTCTVFGQDTTTYIDFNAHVGECSPRGRMTLGPWTAGVIRFPATN